MPLDVLHVGLNNLPKEHNAALARTLVADPLLAELGALGPDLLRQAQVTGYANRFAMLARGTPWRPAVPMRPAASGPTSAIVVGPQGEAEASGAGEIHTFDDSDRQLRVQLKTSQHETQLNLGHLVHQADNHRGSFRGVGFELRTDAWGALRAAGGILISSYGTREHEPSGDNAAALALAQQAQALADAFSRAAGTHQTAQLSALVGLRPEDTPPLKAMHTALAHQEPIANVKVPHTGEPVIAIAAQAGTALVAGQHIQFSNGQALHLGSGQDTSVAAGGAFRVHTGQALAMLGGAVQPGNGHGLQLTAAQGDVVLQAQNDTLELAAALQLLVASAGGRVDFASAKKITLATTGGASITLDKGQLTVQCPGRITVKASVKRMVGPGKVSYALPVMPKSICVECLLNAQAAASPASKR